MEVASGDLKMLRAVGCALLALAASALVLLLSVAVCLDRHYPQAIDSSSSQRINASQFQTVTGNTQVVGDTLLLKSLQYDSGQRLAIVSRTARFSAEKYPLLRYRLEGFQPGLKTELLWRTAETGDSIFEASIPGGSGGTTFANLQSEDDWRGTITDIAFRISGDLRDQPLIISGVSLEPYSLQGLASAVFFEWTGFRGWTSSSINVLPGTGRVIPAETLSPTLAMAAWAGLALIFVYGLGKIRGSKNLFIYGAVVLIPWVALDQLWQYKLSAQLQESRQIFSGKTMHQKHLADVDADIYSYTKRLKEDLLPGSGARLIMLHHSSGHNYERLKTQYYLLPHNIYNFGIVPPSQGIHPGDYILVLGDIPELRYLGEEEVLAWAPNNRLKARLLDTDRMGKLFQVMPPDSGVVNASERTRQD